MKTVVSTLSPDALVDQMILTLNTPLNSNKVVVWVEGKDWRVYRKFFKSDKIIEAGSAGGLVITEAHNKLRRMRPSQKSIVIKDADFGRLEGVSLSADPDIFYSDGHDVEMMMLKQPVVRQKVCEVFEYTGDVDKFYNDIFTELTPLSYFKWYSYHNGNSYSFKDLSKLRQPKQDLMNLTWIESTTYKCSESKWNGSNHSTPFVRIDVTDVENFMNANSSVDMYEVTNGHDFCNRLAMHIQAKTHYVRNEDSIKDSIMVSFDYEQFKNTDLHKSLKNWCSANVDILK